VRQIMLAFAVAIAITVGAVVDVTTVAPNDITRETPLWIVEVGGDLYLRAGSPNAQWLARIENNPLIWLETGGVRQRFEALPLRDDRSVRLSVNRAMAEKYGLADTLVGLLVDPDRSVPILIRPAAH
jgi:hypothetical protein